MKLLFVGDVSLGEYYLSLGHGPKTYASVEYIFESVQTVFDQADIIVGNLEAPISLYGLNSNNPESVVLRADPSHVYQLKKAGFTHMNVANNHMVQHGDKVFDDTVKLLNDNGIQAIGINNCEPIIFEDQGVIYGFLGASDVPDNTDQKQTKYQRLSPDFLENIKFHLKKVDHLILFFHWGLEVSTKALSYQLDIANELYRLGVRVVAGCHPHLFYEIEKRNNFVCAYSLGNFVFDLPWDKKMNHTGILEVNFECARMDVNFWPVEIAKYDCLPCLTGEPVRIEGTYVPYELGASMNFQQIKKIVYFFKFFLIGETFLKARFILKKIANRLIPRCEH